jgi:hypothetical protein
MAGRVLDAGLSLLDRQIEDSDGRLYGKVDDLELLFPDGGGPPVVTAILSGPGALARRIGGRIGAWLESVHARLHPDQAPGPARISFGVVKRIDHSVELSVSKGDLGDHLFEAWVREHVIGKIPGAGS